MKCDTPWSSLPMNLAASTTLALSDIFGRHNIRASSNEVRTITSSLVNKEPVSSEISEKILFNEEFLAQLNPITFCLKATEILGMFLLAKRCPDSDQIVDVLKNNAKSLLKYNIWNEFQPAEAIRQTLNHQLFNIPPSLKPFVTTNGSAPIEHGGHWTWAGVPLQPFQSKMATLWAFLGKESGNDELIKAASDVAKWTFNTLDHTNLPIRSLFCQEDVGETEILTWNYLLLHLVAAITKQPELEHAANRQLEQLKLTTSHTTPKIDLLAYALNSWTEESRLQSTVQPRQQEAHIYDDVMSTMITRENNKTIVSTCCGGKTGLGALIFNDLQIVNFGPQHLPFGECKWFGLEQNFFSRANDILSDHEEGVGPHQHTLKGVSRLTDNNQHTTLNALFQNSKNTSRWIEITHKYGGNEYSLETLLISPDECETLAFSFFVKAESCTIGNDTLINPKSLDRYKGEPQHLYFKGKNSRLDITTNSHYKQMEVIPLAGDESFWGADFLVGYILSKGYLRQCYKISFSENT